MKTAAGALEDVLAAAAQPAISQEAVNAALQRVGSARAEFDRAEAQLIDAARTAGFSWRQIATALGLRSAQAAEQRALRLHAATNDATTGTAPRDVAAERRQRARTRTPPSGRSPAPALADRDGPADPARLEPTEPGEQNRSRRRRARDTEAALTTPGVNRVAERRAVTAADFASDPVHDLVRGTTGAWQVTAAGAVVGTVARAGRSRWAPWTAAGARIGTRTYPSRAEAALQVLIAHQARQGAKTRRRRR